MKKIVVIIGFGMALVAIPLSTYAGIKYEDKAGRYVKLGGHIQLQYHLEDPDDADSTDELIFRRLRPYIEGSVTKDWKGKFQWDMGKSEVLIKDAYMQYQGFENIKIGLGNMYVPFSREVLTSSKEQQLVERTFVGDHNYGVPDRQAGLHLTGHNSSKTFAWGASLALAALDPDNEKMDFDTTIQIDKGDDWSEGPMVGGRVGFHPMGYVDLSQGDFERKFKACMELGGFTWSNDDDNLDPTRTKNDVDGITGFAVSAALRGGGFSVDLEYTSFDSELVDTGITDGLYKNSETTLECYAIEGGYMIVPSKLEFVAGYQSQDADNYEDEWTRVSVGANYFVNKHNIKYQVTYRTGENVHGKKGDDLNELFVQAQYVF
jgi:phosphate-selective porin OprO/OprP